MKCVVTILQNKRVALPFIFGKYCLPKMKEWFNGDIVLYHIFHNHHIIHTELNSNKVYNQEDLEKVRGFIYGGLFPEAFILSHRENNPEHVAIPSCIKAAEVSLRENADFHLWLEDDAIIFDKECHLWEEKLKNADVGIYRNTISKKMINTAFFLSTKEFDKKIIEALYNYKRNDIMDFRKYGSQLEHLLWQNSKSQVVFNNEYAERHHDHFGSNWTVLLPQLKSWLIGNFPNIANNHLDYLYLDFEE